MVIYGYLCILLENIAKLSKVISGYLRLSFKSVGFSSGYQWLSIDIFRLSIDIFRLSKGYLLDIFLSCVLGFDKQA